MAFLSYRVRPGIWPMPGRCRWLPPEIGFPLLLKAAGRRGGRGMRIAAGIHEFGALFDPSLGRGHGGVRQSRRSISNVSFPKVRHIEIQVFGDKHGNTIHLWERDCSIQRRHQKLVEEAPSPVLDCRRACADGGSGDRTVRNFNTKEPAPLNLSYDLDSGRWFFIEMNTRIQVEHPVTEEIFDVDLVAEQMRVAAGEAISFAQPAAPNGRCAIEFRINAEDPANNFRPSPGTVSAWLPPSGPGVRLDSHVYTHYVVPPYYDSLLGKLIISGEQPKGHAGHGQISTGSVQNSWRYDHASVSCATDRLRTALSTATAHTRWVEQEMLV